MMASAMFIEEPTEHGRKTELPSVPAAYCRVSRCETADIYTTRIVLTNFYKYAN